MKFVCVQTCFTNTLVSRGEIVTFPNEEAIDPSVRPFFRPLKSTDKVVKPKTLNTSDGEEDNEFVPNAENAEASETSIHDMSKKELLAECDRVNVSVHPQWGKDKLRQVLTEKAQGM